MSMLSSWFRALGVIAWCCHGSAQLRTTTALPSVECQDSNRPFLTRVSPSTGVRGDTVRIVGNWRVGSHMQATCCWRLAANPMQNAYSCYQAATMSLEASELNCTVPPRSDTLNGDPGPSAGESVKVSISVWHVDSSTNAASSACWSNTDTETTGAYVEFSYTDTESPTGAPTSSECTPENRPQIMNVVPNFGSEDDMVTISGIWRTGDGMRASCCWRLDQNNIAYDCYNAATMIGNTITCSVPSIIPTIGTRGPSIGDPVRVSVHVWHNQATGGQTMTDCWSDGNRGFGMFGQFYYSGCSSNNMLQNPNADSREHWTGVESTFTPEGPRVPFDSYSGYVFQVRETNSIVSSQISVPSDATYINIKALAWNSLRSPDTGYAYLKGKFIGSSSELIYLTEFDSDPVEFANGATGWSMLQAQHFVPTWAEFFSLSLIRKLVRGFDDQGNVAQFDNITVSFVCSATWKPTAAPTMPPTLSHPTASTVSSTTTPHALSTSTRDEVTMNAPIAPWTSAPAHLECSNQNRPRIFGINPSVGTANETVTIFGRWRYGPGFKAHCCWRLGSDPMSQAYSCYNSAVMVNNSILCTVPSRIPTIPGRDGPGLGDTVKLSVHVWADTARFKSHHSVCWSNTDSGHQGEYGSFTYSSCDTGNMVANPNADLLESWLSPESSQPFRPTRPQEPFPHSSTVFEVRGDDRGPSSLIQAIRIPHDALRVTVSALVWDSIENATVGVASVWGSFLNDNLVTVSGHIQHFQSRPSFGRWVYHTATVTVPSNARIIQLQLGRTTDFFARRVRPNIAQFDNISVTFICGSRGSSDPPNRTLVPLDTSTIAITSSTAADNRFSGGSSRSEDSESENTDAVTIATAAVVILGLMLVFVVSLISWRRAARARNLFAENNNGTR